PSVGRFGASLLTAVGLEDWVAESVEGYVALAAAKAKDQAALATLRESLRPRFAASPLGDAKGLARDIEAAFRALWTDWCARTGGREAPTLAAAISAYQAADFERAWTIANGCLAARPADAEARHLRGIAAYRAGRLAEAADDLAQAIEASPARADLRSNLTAVLRSLGRLKDAETQGREAVRLTPEAPECHNNLGSVLKDLGRQGEAEACYRKAIALKPGYADAWSNLAWTLSLAGHAKEAEGAARRALALNPGDANAMNNLGTALLQQERVQEAGACFERAVQLRPGFHVAHSNLLFCLNYRTDLSAHDIFEAFKKWNADHAQRLAPAHPPMVADRNPGRRLRLGYVSPDFRHHAASFFIEPLIGAHDRSKFEITCYADVANPDFVTERFKRLADRWRSTVGLADQQVADLIRADGIDVLIDLAGHTAGNRLLVFARKSAPVQVAHMVGSGTTTGLDAIDVFLADAALVPEGAERFFAERVVRLARIPLVYAPPEGMPDVAPLPATRNGYVTFGCFSRTARINELVVAAWSRILRGVPDARLILNSKPFQEAESRQAWHDRFRAHGIEPKRVSMTYTAPQPKTWAAYGTVDVALDPFPHNAGTTTIEALWMGVPVVSLAGRPPVGRFGASILGSVGFADWVAGDVEGYVAKAVAAAENVAALALLRSTLRDRFKASPLGADPAALAREIEAVYRQLWSDYCSGHT
ncbi:MAG TPA: tetratricopeptide repeat protein, partial [Hyphomicrobiaceae bacterium]|nr:tetratricopeptide repeat protein [Hyphomicrobiaceae bacterium]